MQESSPPNRGSDAVVGDERLAADLRAALAALAPLVARFPVAREAVELLERDLLPRCGAGESYLVCGIVGPNNAGKSALFNALIGRDVSPSDPTGGATRRLVGAAHAALLERLRAHPDVRRFHLRDAELARLREAALAHPDDPTELLVVAEESLPPHVLLIDTPDFDSVIAGNRRVSEVLIAVADVVVAVVTRHSYQNRAVVEFFQEWLRHQRPWILVYNEAIDASVARSHAEKLIRDIGTAPIAAFWAPHRVEIQRGEETLDVRALECGVATAGADRVGLGPGMLASLRELLLDRESAARVKAIAFRASLARLRDGLAATSASVAIDAAGLGAARAHAEQVAQTAGVQIAAQAMPAAPFIEAFRVVLDRRSNVVSRTWRTLVRGVRIGIESIPLWLRGRAGDERSGEVLGNAEVEALGRVWPEYWESLARDLGREGRAPVRRDCPAIVTDALDHDLADTGRDAQTRATAALRARAADLGGFQRACEQLIDEAIDTRGFDLDIQAAADIATLAPVALATAVIITTGGIGSDIAFASGGALGAYVFEKYSYLLGSSITRAARQRWTESRGHQLAEVLLAAALPQALPALDAAQESDAEAGARLGDLQRRFA